jgi:hypothetical protein
LPFTGYFSTVAASARRSGGGATLASFADCTRPTRALLWERSHEGGCGLPQSALDSQDFVALDVFNTPHDYGSLPRPLPAGDPRIGMWNNGLNCGRWCSCQPQCNIPYTRVTCTTS